MQPQGELFLCFKCSKRGSDFSPEPIVLKFDFNVLSYFIQQTHLRPSTAMGQIASEKPANSQTVLGERPRSQERQECLLACLHGINGLLQRGCLKDLNAQQPLANVSINS